MDRSVLPSGNFGTACLIFFASWINCSFRIEDKSDLITAGFT